MGDNALSGLLPGGSVPIYLCSEPQFDEKWSKLELITAGLIQGIQPSKHSEGKRRAIIEHVIRLIQKQFSCQVSTYGSVPLKTYLPDGDIDLSTFSSFPHSSEIWANNLRQLLKREEHNRHAKFCVKEVQVIHAEVQIVKCLVDNVIVDISFNQIGGICTLCFLEEVDRLIGKDHLFKRSIILVKAWCYYESRILGAHHGLISTYALETLVLYIFNVFHASLRGPFEVLCKFLQFFSQFDWKHYCVSLCGPIRLTALHEMTVEPPNKGGGDLLFSRDFLSKCRQQYGDLPIGAPDFQERNFSSKNMNVVDPLRFDNNLGRSVNRGNFFRICRAFAYGAKQIEKLLCGSPEELSENLDEFFRNTRKYSKGHRPDAFAPRLFDVSVSAVPSMTKDSEEAGGGGAHLPIEKLHEASQNTSGRLMKAGSSSTIDLSNETVESTLSTGNMTLKSWPNLENVQNVSRIENDSSGQCVSPAAMRSRLEMPETASRRMSKINFSNTNGVSKKADDSLPVASDMTMYNRGNIENARDLSSIENGCNGFRHEADSSAAMAVQCSDTAMPIISSMADEQPAMLMHTSSNSSILTGDLKAHVLSLHTGRMMVASQLCSFPQSVMFPSRHMFEPYASEGPGRPTNGEMNLFTQVFAYNYQQYLPSFQGLSLQNPFAMPSNRGYRGDVPKSHRGTGTYLPNLRSGVYRDTQPMRGSRGSANAPKFPEWNGIANQNEANAFTSNYSHGGARHEGGFSANARPEKRNSFERSIHGNGCMVQEDKLPKFPATTSANIGGTTLKATSQAPDNKPFIAADANRAEKDSCLDISTPNSQTALFGRSSNNSENGFLTQSLEFGSLGSTFLGRPRNSLVYEGLRKEHDGLKLQNPQNLKNGDGGDSAEVTAKKVLFNENQPSQLKCSYELKEEDFPPLSTNSQSSKSTASTTQKDSTGDWSHFQACATDSNSSWSLPKLQQHVDS
eukprot:c15519_g1_i1 orf=234-3122(-)